MHRFYTNAKYVNIHSNNRNHNEHMYFTKEFIQRIYRLGILLVIILAITDLLFFFYYSENGLAKIFLATREQTPLTWISSLALLFIALSCFSAYLDSKKKLWGFFCLSLFSFLAWMTLSIFMKD